MGRHMCMNCGCFIINSAHSDSYLCRDCEKILEGVDYRERYAYIENY